MFTAWFSEKLSLYHYLQSALKLPGSNLIIFNLDASKNNDTERSLKVLSLRWRDTTDFE